MDYKVTSAQLTAIADAIRAKSGGESALVFPDGFVSEAGNIVTPDDIGIKLVEGPIQFSASTSKNIQPRGSSTAVFVADIPSSMKANWIKTDTTAVPAADMTSMSGLSANVLQLTIQLNRLNLTVGVTNGTSYTRSITASTSKINLTCKFYENK